MNILRQPPFPLSVTYDGLTPEETYLMQIYNDHTALMDEIDVVADSSGVVTQDLPVGYSKYDDTYSLYIYSLDELGEPDNAVVIDTLYIYRPYSDPYSLASTDGEVEEYIRLERLAREIVDAFTDGFYYTSTKFETTGLGIDYLPVPKRINKINYVYENNELVYSRFNSEETVKNYYITPDYTAITIATGTGYNRYESKPQTLPIAASDSYQLYGDDYDAVQALTMSKGPAMFPKGADYIVYGEFGWPVVPQDIKDAMAMLVDDIKCNRLSYVNRYMKEYETDQFKIKLSDISWSGTGNLLVDRILKKYRQPINRLGVI
jgi:hypothetical protein